MSKPEINPATVEAVAEARDAGLSYVSDRDLGFHREGKGKRIRYRDQRGKIIRDPNVLDRIRGLAIPPAWTEVWICPKASGHVQAVGRDLRGRKQYRYHADWRVTRDATKFARMVEFGRALPKIRRVVSQDLRSRGLGREKIVAAMVRLLETTHIRVGNEEYAKQNHSFGLSTLRDRHVKIRAGTMKFNFLGKSGKTHEIELHDPRLAAIVRRAQDLPGQELFQYLDENGEPQKVSSEDVNAYLREAAGAEFSAKDFRTWAGTVLAALALAELLNISNAKPTKKNLLEAIGRVAEKLGNTPSICRKCYIHPAVMDGYLEGETIALLRPRMNAASSRANWRLGMEEMAVLSFLRKKLRRPRRPLKQLLAQSIARRKKEPNPSERQRVA